MGIDGVIQSYNFYGLANPKIKKVDPKSEIKGESNNVERIKFDRNQGKRTVSYRRIKNKSLLIFLELAINENTNFILSSNNELLCITN